MILLIIVWCSITTAVMSDQQFTESVNKCMESFTPHVHQYTTIIPKDPFIRHIFIQHVCKNYKKMLLCIHTVLTNCYTEENIEIVQHKLGYDWVIKINSMCDIQSNSSNHFKSQQDINSKNILKHGDKDVKLQHEEKGNFNISTPKESELLGKLTKYVLLNKHSHDTDVEIITMFVFRTALQTTKQSGSMPNSWNGADVQKLQKLERMQKSRPSNLLEMIISYCTTINKGFKLAKQDFLAQSENFSNRNGSVRHFSWQVVIFISAVNYLYNFV